MVWSEEADSLIAKVAGVEAAKENETKLVVYVGLVTGAREREEAAKNERIAKINNNVSRKKQGSKPSLQSAAILLGRYGTKSL